MFPCPREATIGRKKKERRSSRVSRSRPFGVTLIAALCALGALEALYYTLMYLGIRPFTIGDMQFYGQNFWGALLWALSVLAYLWAMRALWTLDPQGWMFAVLISGFNLILAFVSLLGGSSFQALLPSIVVNAAILIYCLMPNTKEAFGRV
jgi:hypothetical protein